MATTNCLVTLNALVVVVVVEPRNRTITNAFSPSNIGFMPGLPQKLDYDYDHDNDSDNEKRIGT